MFDAALRPLIDPPLAAGARTLARFGVSANAVSVIGLVAGLGAGVAIAVDRLTLALALIVLSRLLDGLDGALARTRGKTDFGGYLDLFADFVFYAAVPLGFAIREPAHALPAAALLASFLLSGIAFTGYAILAARRGLETAAQGEKSFYYAQGLAEGAETIAAFVLAVLKPQWFPIVAYAFAALCCVSAVARLAAARGRFR
jgi:phosphatidylglycerophosphate synthase